MSQCKNCGVILDESIKVCPLCGLNAGQTVIEDKPQGNYPSDILTLYKKETLKNIWELSGIIAFSGIAVVTIVDLVIGKELKWSLIADASIFSAWIMLTLFLKAFRKPYVLVPCLLGTILTMLFMIDIFSSGLKWFFPLALPVTLTVFVAITIILVLWQFLNFKGFNLLAVFFLLVAGFCIVTETVVDHYLFDIVEMRWALITAISILPIALVFIFLHYRMKKGRRLDSFFHI